MNNQPYPSELHQSQELAIGSNGSAGNQPEPEEPVYMQHIKLVLVILHLSVFVTGLVGNSLVCLSVYRNKSLQTVTNYYIVNLAIADFLVILICLPPTVYWDLNLTWNFGLVLCKLVLYLQSISVSVSVLTLTCISIDRWYAICKPLQFSSTKSRAKLTILLIWFASMIFASPDVLYLTIRTLFEEDGYVYADCFHNWPEANQRIYQLCIVILLFVGPFVLMTISYSQIVNVLWRNETMMDSLQHSFQIEEQQLTRRKLAAAAARARELSLTAAPTTTNQRQQIDSDSESEIPISPAAPEAERKPNREYQPITAGQTVKQTPDRADPSGRLVFLAKVNKLDFRGKSFDDQRESSANARLQPTTTAANLTDGLTGRKVSLNEVPIMINCPIKPSKERPNLDGQQQQQQQQQQHQHSETITGSQKWPLSQVAPSGSGALPEGNAPIGMQLKWSLGPPSSKSCKDDQSDRKIPQIYDRVSKSTNSNEPDEVSSIQNAIIDSNLVTTRTNDGKPPSKVIHSKAGGASTACCRYLLSRLSDRSRVGRKRPTSKCSRGRPRETDDITTGRTGSPADQAQAEEKAKATKPQLSDRRIDKHWKKKYYANLAEYAAKRDKSRQNCVEATRSENSCNYRKGTKPTSSTISRPINNLEARSGQIDLAEQTTNEEEAQLSSRPSVPPSGSATLTRVSFGSSTLLNVANSDAAANQSQPLPVAVTASNSAAAAAAAAAATGTETRFCKLIESRKKAAKMLIVIVIMFGLCYLPIHLINTLRCTIGLPQNDLTTLASLISHWLCYFNSAVNPLIYNLMSGKFRHEFANLFLCKCFRSNSPVVKHRTLTKLNGATNFGKANKPEQTLKGFQVSKLDTEK